MNNERADVLEIPEGYTAEQYYSELMEKMKTGDAEATFKAGLCFRDGIGCARSETNFAACLMIAANKGYEPANTLCSELGPSFFIRAGDAFRKSKIMQNSMQCYLWAFKLGDRSICVILAEMYAKGLGAEKNTDLAAKVLRIGAQAGDADAQYRYSRALADGQWVQQDDKAAAEWCRKAAEQGHIKACLYTGLYAWYDEDVFAAEEWFQKAADRNDPDGLRLLAELYDEELGEPEEAFELLTRSSDLGCKDADLDIGKWYLFGHEWLYGRIHEAVPGDHKKAAEILRRLAEDDDYEDAYYYWALCLLDGYGVSEDPRSSIEWLKKAAENGSADAQELMGYLCAMGYDHDPDWSDEDMRSDYYGDAQIFNQMRHSILERSYNSWMKWHNSARQDDALRALKWYRMAAEQGDMRAADQICILSEHLLEKMRNDPDNADAELVKEVSSELDKWKRFLGYV